MVRMAELTASARANLEALHCPTFADAAFTGPRSLAQAKVALVSTAGLMARDTPNVHGSTGGYRVIDNATPDNDVLVNHVSVNFDRTGYQRDINVILPRDRLSELVDQNVVAGMSDAQYAFMGATDPEHMREHVTRLGEELVTKGVNTVCLLPV